MIRVVRIGSLALDDFAEAIQWYEASGMGWAFMRELHAKIALVEKNPGLGTPVEADVRRMLLNRFPYWLYYRTQGDVLRVIACIDSRRDQSQVLERIQ